METIGKTRKPLDKTLRPEYIARMISQEPLTTFEDNKELGIRRKCLEAMRDERSVYSHITIDMADWAEQAICDFVKHKDELLLELIEWYLFCAKHEAIIVRSLKFVISLKQKDPIRFSYRTTSKLIAGRIKRDANLFECKYLDPLADFLKDYVREILYEFRKDGQISPGYFSDDWQYLKRALNILVVAKEYSLLSEINSLIMLFQEKKIKCSDSFDFYEKDMHLAMIKSVKRRLEFLKRKHR